MCYNVNNRQKIGQKPCRAKNCHWHLGGATPMRINVAIVEDDLSSAQELKQFLSRFGESTDISFSVAHFSDATQFLRPYQPVYDIIFMDIRMPGIDGMSAAQKLRQVDPVTVLVFVTSVVQYAVKGYEVDATDFIVKPLRYPAFNMKMKRILRAVQARKEQGIVVTVDGSSRVIPAISIYYVEIADHNLTYHTVDGDYTVRGKLSSVEQRLPADSFFRCSASFLINLRYTTQVAGEDVYVAGTPIRFSRAKKKELLTAIASYLGKGV